MSRRAQRAGRRMERQVIHHNIRQTRRETRPSRPTIRRSIDTKVGSRVERARVAAVYHDDIDRLIRQATAGVVPAPSTVRALVDMPTAVTGDCNEDRVRVGRMHGDTRHIPVRQSGRDIRP